MGTLQEYEKIKNKFGKNQELPQKKTKRTGQKREYKDNANYDQMHQLFLYSAHKETKSSHLNYLEEAQIWCYSC
jgi:hypothetical protein